MPVTHDEDMKGGGRRLPRKAGPTRRSALVKRDPEMQHRMGHRRGVSRDDGGSLSRRTGDGATSSPMRISRPWLGG